MKTPTRTLFSAVDSCKKAQEARGQKAGDSIALFRGSTVLLWLIGTVAILWTFTARADRARVTNAVPVKAGPAGAAVQFDLGWDISWRNSISHDACWVFVKFSTDGGASWRHATLGAAGLNPAGCTAGAGTPVEIIVPADHKGAFIRRAQDGSGRTEAKGIQLGWDIKADGVADPAAAQLRVFALEMVYNPEGPFWLGGWGDEPGRFVEGGPKRRALVRHQPDDTYMSQGEIIIHSNLFPQGLSPKAACSVPAGEVAIKPTRKNIMTMEQFAEAASRTFAVDSGGRYEVSLALHSVHWNARIAVEGFRWKPEVKPHDGEPKIEELQKIWESRPLRFTHAVARHYRELNLAFPPGHDWLKSGWLHGRLDFPAVDATVHERAAWREVRFARVRISAPYPLEDEASTPYGVLRIDDVEVRRLAGSSAPAEGNTAPAVASGPVLVPGLLADILRKTKTVAVAKGESAASALRLAGTDGSPAAEATTASLRWDDKGLTVVFECEDAQVKADKRERDDPQVWKDDSVDIFLDPGRRRDLGSDNWLHFIVSADGTVFDERGPVTSYAHTTSGNPQGGDRAWNAPGVAVKTERTPAGWRMEVCLPWDDLGGRPDPGALWGFNVTRASQPGGKIQSLFPYEDGWAPSIYFSDNWGNLFFAEGKLAEQPAQLASLFRELGVLAVPKGGEGRRLGPFAAVSGGPAASRTEALARWDDRGLEVKFTMASAAGRAEKRERNDPGILGDDAVRLFLDSGTVRDSRSNTWLQVVLNAAGSVLGERGPLRWTRPLRGGAFGNHVGTPPRLPLGGETNWNLAGLKTGVLAGKPGWQAELSLPWEDVGAKPKAGDLWGFNLARTDGPDGEWQCLVPTELPLNTIERWGWLLFVEKPLALPEIETARATAPDAPADAKNLVFNGSFEQGLEGWTAGIVPGYSHITDKSEPFRVSNENPIEVGNETGKLWYAIPPRQKAADIGDQAGPIQAAFPKGYKAFYMMKTELLTWQYRDYLNTLPPTQAKNRMGRGFNGVSPNINAQSSINETSRGYGFTFLGYNDASWPDLAAYADWSGLRPMTELEFEKAARGPLYPVPNEYSWGTAFGIIPIPFPRGLVLPTNAPYMFPDTDREYHLPREANVSFMGGAPGPTRPGCYSYEGASRVQQGAGYYGALDLSGNLFEMMITAGNPEGRAFTAAHGDGLLTATGEADVPGWPAPAGTGKNATCTGWGIRGGGFYRPWMKTVGCRLADRNVAIANSAARPNFFCSAGIRVGRLAP